MLKFLVSLMFLCPGYENIPVAIVTNHVEIHGSDTVASWTTHDMIVIPVAEWTMKFGPLTDLDIRELSISGCLRIHTTLHHYTL